MANFPMSLSWETSLNIGWQSIADTRIYDMVAAESSGGAAAQALRALRRAAQLHTERRGTVTAKPGKIVQSAPRAIRGRGAGAAQTDVASQQSQFSQPTQPASQLPLSQSETVPGWEQFGSQREAWASMSTQTPSHFPPSSTDASQRGSQAQSQPLWCSQPVGAPMTNASQPKWHPLSQPKQPTEQVCPASLSQPLWAHSQPEATQCSWSGSQGHAELLAASGSRAMAADNVVSMSQAAVYPSRVTGRHGSQGRASVNDFPPQAQPNGVAEAAAALAAALAPLAAAPVQAGEERKRRRYRHKAPPPQECTPISTRPPSPRSASTGRKRDFGLSHAEVLAETATAAIGLSLERLSEDIGQIGQERAARRAACQQAASEALHLLDKHRPACRESRDALAGAVKAADAALAAVAALERLHAPDVQNRLSTCPLPSQPLQMFGGPSCGLGGQGPLRKRVRRIDGIAA
ncbi:unnamed protein product [Symbiodinium sp. CCMP2592]|nr:unnamed protein product [Symbiodinium sp. CCMP2592]